MEVRAERGRHRAPPRKAQWRAPGPVTAVHRIIAVKPPPAASFALRAWPAVPALVLAWPAAHGRLLGYADAVLGYDATLCLVATLLITPVITATRAPIAKLRFWYGIWVFLLGAAAFAIHLAYPPTSMAASMAGDSVNWTGTLIVVLLLPLAATSSAVAQKLLGPEWKRWQRNLVWVVWACVGVHFAFMHAWLILGAYLAASAPGMVIRRPRVRRAVKAWRAARYENGNTWVLMGVLGTVALAGFVVLVTEEGVAVAHAVTLAGHF